MSTSSRPAKRSRIVTADAPQDTSSTGSSSAPTTTSRSNVNVRQLAHTVTLRLRHSRQLRQHGAHTEVERTQEIAELESFNMDLDETGLEADIEEEDTVEEVEGSKRRVVRAFFI